MHSKPQIWRSLQPLLVAALSLTNLQAGFTQEVSLASPQPKPGTTQSATVTPSAPADQPQSNNPIIKLLDEELQRSFDKLKGAGRAPVYYLAYRLYEGNWETFTGVDGALEDDDDNGGWRMLSIDLRVGNPNFDNTHQQRDSGARQGHEYDATSDNSSILPVTGADIALRQSFWLKTDAAFKHAQQTYASLQSSKAFLTEEEDKSGDFSMQPAHVYYGPIKDIHLDRKVWNDRVRRMSALFLKYPHLKDTKVQLTAEPTTRYFVNTEGSKQIEQRLRYRMSVSGSAQAEDGMSLSLSDYEECSDPDKLPDEKKIAEMIDNLAKRLIAFREAPIADPYVGPAILSGRAAAVFFHETLGHRVEAQHQKNEEEGKTFAKRIGSKVMPSFLTVIDDPTQTYSHGHELVGHYAFDDEGVPAQAVTIAKNGVLQNFLMGRKPVLNFKTSNGHGRGAPGWNPAARQGILEVFADPKVTVSPAELRSMLIKEAKKQHKDYGLLFDDIYGGSTSVNTYSAQTFSIYPLRIFKVFVDGRPDELIRGADITGTPLAALEKIIAASNDYGVFNGSCGRESGWVPNSAIAPSMLIQTMEIKHSRRSFHKPPILPEPKPADNAADKSQTK